MCFREDIYYVKIDFSIYSLKINWLKRMSSKNKKEIKKKPEELLTPDNPNYGICHGLFGIESIS